MISARAMRSCPRTTSRRSVYNRHLDARSARETAPAQPSVSSSIFIDWEFHGMQGFDAAKLAGTVMMFALTMLLASLAPAIRASRVDPISIFKQG